MGHSTNDIDKRSHRVKQDMQDGAAEQMQAWYPEGYVFMNAMYGSAICNYPAQNPPDTKEFEGELKNQ